VNTVMNFRIPEKAGDLTIWQLSNWIAISVWKRRKTVSMVFRIRMEKAVSKYHADFMDFASWGGGGSNLTWTLFMYTVLLRQSLYCRTRYLYNVGSTKQLTVYYSISCQ